MATNTEVPYAENMVVVENLVKHFDEVKAVDGISFTIRKGEIFGLARILMVQEKPPPSSSCWDYSKQMKGRCRFSD